MIKQPTVEEYDLALLIAKRDLATNGSVNYTVNQEAWEYKDDSDYTSGDEFITRERFFKDLRRANQQIKPKSSTKPSKT